MLPHFPLKWGVGRHFLTGKRLQGLLGLSKSSNVFAWKLTTPDLYWARAFVVYAMAALCLVFLSGLPSQSAASAANRSLKLYYVHTGERAPITFKKNGKFDKSGLEKLNRFLRDWRRNEPTRMDPRLFDLIWEVYQRSGSRDYINVLSAYRAPATNALLRSRSKGVAKNSQHILGKAMDFYIPGVSLKKLREIGLKLQVGGVGYYPTSGSPFVHMDVGGVRAWPRASRQDLVRLFPDGKTLHIPPDGKPLPGYQAALADYKRRVGAASIEVADSAGKSSGKRKNLLQILFGGGDEDEEPEAISSKETVVVASAAKAPTKTEPKTTTALPGVEKIEAPVPGVRPVFRNNDNAAPIATALVPPARETSPEAIQAASPDNVPSQPEFADLSQYRIPLPQLLGKRRLPGDAESELAQVDREELTTPETGSGDIQEVAAVTPASTAETSNDELTALLNRINDESPADQDEALQKMAMLSPEPPVSRTRSLAGQVGTGKSSEPKTSNENTSVAALSLTSLPDAFSNDSGTGKTPIEPKKGARPSLQDASAASRASLRGQPKLTPELIAKWAITKRSIALESKPVKAPRFVSRIMRAQPKIVYAAGFSSDGNVDPNRFAGNAVNFMKVRKF